VQRRRERHGGVLEARRRPREVEVAVEHRQVGVGRQAHALTGAIQLRADGRAFGIEINQEPDLDPGVGQAQAFGHDGAPELTTVPHDDVGPPLAAEGQEVGDHAARVEPAKDVG